MNGMNELLSVIEALGSDDSPFGLDELKEVTGLSSSKIKALLSIMDARNLIEITNGKYSLRLQSMLIKSEENARAKHETPTPEESIAVTIEQPFAIANREGKMIYANDNFLKLWGYRSQEEVIGRSATEFWKNPHEAEKVIHAISKQHTWSGELEAVRSDQRTEKLLVTAAQLPCSTCQTSCIVASFARIQEQTLKTTDLDQSDSRVSDILFKHTLHDLNNYLFLLSAHIEYLADTPTAGGENADILSETQAVCDRAVKCIRNALNDAHEKKCRVDIREIINEFTIRSVCGKNIKHRIYIAPDISSVWGKRRDITQLIANIMINARQAMKDNGMITISAANVICDEPPGSLTAGKYCLISITDTGKGMNEADLENIFELNYTTKENGSGLGLPRCKEILEEHKGFLTVKSQEGVGAVFDIYLPALD